MNIFNEFKQLLLNYIMTLLLGYPDGIYQYIFITALVIHPTHIYAGVYYNMPHCAIIGITLYATSLNYWRFPLINSTRRTIDMVVAKSSISYHVYLSFYASNKFLTTFPIMLGSSLYLVSLYLHHKKYIKLAACCHCLLHLLVSIGASFIYKDYYNQY